MKFWALFYTVKISLRFTYICYHFDGPEWKFLFCFIESLLLVEEIDVLQFDFQKNRMICTSRAM